MDVKPWTLSFRVFSGKKLEHSKGTQNPRKRLYRLFKVISSNIFLKVKVGKHKEFNMGCDININDLIYTHGTLC